MEKIRPNSENGLLPHELTSRLVLFLRTLRLSDGARAHIRKLKEAGKLAEADRFRDNSYRSLIDFRYKDDKTPEGRARNELELTYLELFKARKNHSALDTAVNSLKALTLLQFIGDIDLNVRRRVGSSIYDNNMGIEAEIESRYSVIRDQLQSISPKIS